MAKKVFDSTIAQDFVILEEGEGKYGEIRIKPSGISWKAKNSQIWHKVSMEEFAAFAEENGKQNKK